MLARNPLEEARSHAGDTAWVLEPSPPAVDDGQWFADDPVASGDLDWGKWLAAHPERETWAAERWLGAYRRLAPTPATCAETRRALHRLAVHVVSPARQRMANGKMALRWTLGGIGTPFFGDDEQVRLAGTTIVRQHRGSASSAPVTTLREAAALALGGPPDGAWAKELDAPPAGDIDEPLSVDGEAAAYLGDWYGFAWSVLEELRADPESTDPTRVQLWPEHFDAAFDCLRPDRRATFGASPGDAAEPDPYLYVISPKAGDVPGDVWDATSFKGAIMRLGELTGVNDQRAAALEFFRSCRFSLDR